MFPGSFGLARRSDSIFSGIFGSREDDTSRSSTTNEDQTNFDYNALESPNAFYADDYVDNTFQQAEGGNTNGRNARRRNRNR